MSTSKKWYDNTDSWYKRFKPDASWHEDGKKAWLSCHKVKGKCVVDELFLVKDKKGEIK